MFCFISIRSSNKNINDKGLNFGFRDNANMGNVFTDVSNTNCLSHGCYRTVANSTIHKARGRLPVQKIN